MESLDDELEFDVSPLEVEGSKDKNKEGDDKDEEVQNNISDKDDSVSDVSNIKMVDDSLAGINGLDEWDIIESVTTNNETVANYASFDDNLLNYVVLSQLISQMWSILAPIQK